MEGRTIRAASISGREWRNRIDRTNARAATSPGWSGESFSARYVLVKRVKGLDAGLYRHLPLKNRLCLARGARAKADAT